MIGSERRARREEEMEEDFNGKPRGAYHKFFEGYTEAKAPRKSGHGEKIIRRYTSPWKQADLGKKEWIERKIFTGLASCVTIVLIFFSIFHDAAGHNEKVVVALEAGLILSVIFLVTALVTYLSASYRMTIWEYKSGSQKFIQYGKVVAVLSGLAGIVMLVSAAIVKKRITVNDVLSVLAAFAACAILVLLIYSENQITYVNIKNDTEKPKDGREIWVE